MLRGIYTAASGMESQITRQDTIANNLANVNTAGFKKDETIIKQFPEMEIYRKDDNNQAFGSKPKKNKLKYIGNLGTGANVIDVATQFEQGAVKYTNNDFDFAIQGDSFFSVETPNGIKVTKSGNFVVNNLGYLTDGNGNRVLGVSEGGEIGYITGEPINISDNGNLVNGIIEEADFSDSKLENLEFQGENNKILLLDIENKEDLIKEGANNYSLSDIEETQIFVNGESKVRQGYLERSTVSNIKEMVNMIDCSRSYESNQKVLRTQDELLAKAVNEIGKWT
ncbi:MAG: flagellar hook-basal body protein [Fusobacteriota bacterium]